MSLLLSYAENQLMNAELAKELAVDLLEVYQRVRKLEEIVIAAPIDYVNNI